MLYRIPTALGLFLLSALLHAGCSTCQSEVRADRLGAEATGSALDRNFERVNRLVAARSEQQMEGYVRRHTIEGLQRDGQGLRFRIDGMPLGPMPEEGVRVAIAYTMELLDGTVCEHTDSISPLIFSVGRREHTVGLDELIKRMAPGQTGLAVVPPHLAYGLVGHAGVPSNACVVYRIGWMRYPKQ